MQTCLGRSKQVAQHRAGQECLFGHACLEPYSMGLDILHVLHVHVGPR